MGLDSEWGSPAPEVVEGMGGNEIPCEGEQGGEPPGYWCSHGITSQPGTPRGHNSTFGLGLPAMMEVCLSR